MIRLTTCANDAYCPLFDKSSRMTPCSISTVQYINSFCMQRPVFILLDIRGCASVSEQKPFCCVSWICLFCCKAAVIAGPSALLCKATPPSRTRYVLLVHTGLSCGVNPGHRQLCTCSICRKVGGTGGSINLGAKADTLIITQGKKHIRYVRASCRYQYRWRWR